ncbi:MAG: efflux RND transporter permease subunit, partial [Proteobacteria bacterium]|nr:efflux RND transporter permease subunit [Pseudomonadota bacterium]
MWITRTAVNQPVFATMVMVAITVLGLASYQRLRVEQMPDVSLPFVFVETSYPGASPESVESDVTRPIEYALNAVAGVKTIRSNSLEGSSQVFAEFRLDTDMSQAMQDVRDKVAQVRPGFPKDVGDPLVVRADTQNQQPVVSLAVLSPTSGLRELTSLTDQTIVKGLENVPGVARLNVNGRQTREIRIQIKPNQLTALGIGVDQVIAAIKNANQDVPAGRLTRGQTDTVVRVEGKVKDPAQFGRIIVAQQGGGPVYLSQVADVIDGEKEEDSIARINGHRAITIDLLKAQDANIVETGAQAVAAIEELRKRLPSDVELRIVNNTADQVQRSINRVKETIVEGALLTILIVFMFLHSWRSTVITGLTLPLSVVATFIALNAFGFTLNFLTLMALSLCIGLLIDDAIVVRENIVRHLGMGKDHRRAALEGTEEIGLAVMATTFAIVAVFVPIAFMHGLIGRFFFQFGLTVAVAVLVSLFVSFTLDPMLSAVWDDPVAGRFGRMRWLARLMDRVERLIERVHVLYGHILDWALAHRVKVVVLAIVLFLGSFLLVPFIGSEFVPPQDQGFISLRLNTPVGSSLQYTDTKVKEVEALLKSFPEIDLVTANVGTEEGRNYARVDLKLVDRAKRHRSQQELEVAIRDAVLPIAGIGLSLGFDRPIFVNVLGPDPGTLSQIMADLYAKVSKVPGIADLETSDKAANPAVSVRLNNDLAAELGITVQQVGNTLRPLLAGDTVSYWLGPDGQNYEVNVQLSRDRRQLVSDMGNLYLSTNQKGPNGEARMVPLRQVAEIVETTSPQIIKREGLQRRVALYAGAQGRPAGDVGNDVDKIVKATVLPPGYRFTSAGQQQDMVDSFNAALAALGLAVVFIYLILASQFASYTQPLAIMASLPLSLIGVFLALLFTHSTLNIFSMIGCIMLMGLVTKNAILLVDFANRARRAGASLTDALREAGQVRLRPILMTTLAMIGGMLPLALGLGEGGETQAPMGRAIIGGVITSTLLTLVVVPVLYAWLDARREKRLARKAARADRRAAAAAARGGAGGP